MPRTNELTLLPKLPLLITESADEFDALRDAFEQEVKPHGIVEQMYVHDISSIVWEILRLRRCKVVLINSAFRSALQSLLTQVLKQPGQYEYDVQDEAQALAQAWFTDQEAKKQVSELLSQFELDETAVEAEAIRRSSSDLELLDRMLTSLESRRNKALGCVAEYVLPWRTNCGRARTASLTARVFFDSKMRPTSIQRLPDHGERTTNCRQPSQRAQEYRSPFGRG
jgi:hypothetical protein